MTSRSVSRASWPNAHMGNGMDALFSVASAIKSLAEGFVSGSAGSTTSPQHCSAAIHRLEDDDDLSESEQVAAICLFSHHTYVADTYLAIKKKATRTQYI
jgi:hypothetical protein